MNIVFIAGGLGTAPVYPQVKWMHEHGVDVDVIVGAKNKGTYNLRGRDEGCCW